VQVYLFLSWAEQHLPRFVASPISGHTTKPEAIIAKLGKWSWINTPMGEKFPVNTWKLTIWSRFFTLGTLGFVAKI
jgi:hypothetical protein